MTPPPLPVPPAPPNDENLYCVIDTPCLHFYGDVFIHDRAIVAAYCEVAWLKEAERLRSVRGCFSRGEERAYANARQWRAWGEAK